MKTNEEIAAIKNATMIEFAADLEKNILDHTHLRPGCHTDLDGAQVFEELASINCQSVRGLGNDCNWNLSGRAAAEQIAAHRAADQGDEYGDVLEAIVRA